jgi:hypothetical protein
MGVAPFSLFDTGVAPFSLFNLGLTADQFIRFRGGRRSVYSIWGWPPFSLFDMGVAPFSLFDLGVAPFSLFDLGVAAVQFIRFGGGRRSVYSIWGWPPFSFFVLVVAAI